MTRQSSTPSDVNVQEPNIDAFKERMSIAIERGGGATIVAKSAGVSGSVLRKWKAGGSDPSRTNLVNIARAAGVSVEWLATGAGSPDAGPPGAHQLESTDLGADYAMIPLYDVQAAAGHGAVVEDQQATDALAFKKQWIHRELHANPGDLYLIHVVGESMEPTLTAGDIILVDHRPGAQGVTHDGIYVLRMDGGLLVKRLQRLPGHRIKLSSDNSAYDPFELSLDSAGNDLEIIGRVVWSGRRM